MNSLEVVSSASLGTVAYFIARKISPTMSPVARAVIAIVATILVWSGLRYWRQCAAAQVVASIEEITGTNVNQIQNQQTSTIDLPEEGILIDI